MLFDHFKPWLVITVLGIFIFVLAALIYFGSPQFGAGISLIMTILSYLTAPAAWRIFHSNNYRKYPLGVFYAYLAVGSSTLSYNMVVYDVIDTHHGFNVFLGLYILLGILFVIPKPIE